MPLSLKQRVLYHKKRQVDFQGKRSDRYFSIGYVSGQNLFDTRIWSDEQRRAVVKEKFSNIREFSKYEKLTQPELEELSRSKGLISYASDLAKEKQKKGLSLFDKKIKKGK